MPHDLSQVHTYYEECLQHDEPARQVSWRSAHDQELRFENLLEAIDEEGLGRPLTVLDVGCGLGALYGYLEATGRQARYLGVDVVPQMVARAQARWPQGRFEVRDILADPPRERFDLVVCSGALSVRVPRHERFVQDMLVQMLTLAEGAVAVNFQSTRVGAMDEEGDRLYRADPLRLYGLCRRLCRWTALREDMLATDFTIYLYPGHSRSVSRYGRLPSPRPDAVGVAWLLLERRLPEQALALLEGHGGPDALNLRGMAHHQRGQWSEAARCYREALAQAPDHQAARINLEALERRMAEEQGQGRGRGGGQAQE